MRTKKKDDESNEKRNDTYQSSAEERAPTLAKDEKDAIQTCEEEAIAFVVEHVLGREAASFGNVLFKEESVVA